MARALAVVSVLLVVGCRVSFDASTDAGSDATDADQVIDFPWSNGASIGELDGVTALVIAEDVILSSDTGELTTATGTELRPDGEGLVSGIFVKLRPSQPTIVGVDELTINSQASLRIVGQAPIIFASRSTITIEGTIDVSAGLCPNGDPSKACSGPSGGDGADVADTATGCSPGSEGENVGDTGGGGGAFGTSGGDGGNELDDMMNPGGVGGSSADCDPSLVPLTGGSGGGRAGGMLGGAGGGGGGAVQLSAIRRIEVSGLVRAVGEGGTGAENSGGGGGGSGGGILLEAAAIAISGILTANGGGGGLGGANVDGERGTDSALPARGGGGAGADGGDGSTGVVEATDGSADTNDTGGGGGGAGVIRSVSFGVSIGGGAIISPPPNNVVIE